MTVNDALFAIKEEARWLRHLEGLLQNGNLRIMRYEDKRTLDARMPDATCRPGNRPDSARTTAKLPDHQGLGSRPHGTLRETQKGETVHNPNRP